MSEYEPISVKLGQLIDMIDDAQQAERAVLNAITHGEWTAVAAESAAMRRAISFMLGDTPDRRRAAWAYLAIHVKADYTQPYAIAVGLLRHMEEIS